MESEEEWRPIYGYEQLYEVSSLGRVRNVGSGPYRKFGLILKTRRRNITGHLQVNLFNETKRSHFVHHLVAAAFLGKRPPGMLVLHTNGVATDNRACNLRYGTHRENIADAIRHGMRGAARGERHGLAKLTDEIVRQIREVKNPNFSALSRVYGVHEGTIKNAHTGRTWRHV